MSMEIYVLSDRRLSSLAEWQRSINTIGFTVSLPIDVAVQELHGFLPVAMGTGRTGFECDHWNASELMDFYKAITFQRRWSYCLAFRWGSDFEEGLAACQAAAAYALAVDGVVFDPQEGLVMSPQQALVAARQFEADIPKMREAVQAALAKLGNP
jgi:hypothetical protein